jgi:hypothetical protein
VYDAQAKNQNDECNLKKMAHSLGARHALAARGGCELYGFEEKRVFVCTHVVSES